MKYLKVRRYARTHAALLGYLADNVGEPVLASRLRIVTGDQVHTERRVRELRDLGLAVTWKSTMSENHYVLESLEPNVGVGAPVQAAANVGSDKSLRPSVKDRLLRLVGRPLLWFFPPNHCIVSFVRSPLHRSAFPRALST